MEEETSDNYNCSWKSILKTTMGDVFGIFERGINRLSMGFPDYEHMSRRKKILIGAGYAFALFLVGVEVYKTPSVRDGVGKLSRSVYAETVQIKENLQEKLLHFFK